MRADASLQSIAPHLVSVVQTQGLATRLWFIAVLNIAKDILVVAMSDVKCIAELLYYQATHTFWILQNVLFQVRYGTPIANLVMERVWSQIHPALRSVNLAVPVLPTWCCTMAGACLIGSALSHRVSVAWAIIEKPLHQIVLVCAETCVCIPIYNGAKAFRILGPLPYS